MTTITTKTTAQLAEARFLDPDLLKHVFQELDRYHVGDDSEKVLALLCCVTASMKPKYRVSFRVCGDSTAGKDNLISAVLKHTPGTFATYTGASDKFLVRLVDSKPGLYVGELNLQRQGGANQNLVEILKAAAEGGTCYGFLEPDEHGKYAAKENKVEKKVVIFSGTEITQDDELSTRILSIAVSGSPEQTRAVLDRLADEDETQREDETQATWIASGIAGLDGSLDVVIPNDIKKALAARADSSDVRARRDYKRLLALIRASAWLHQRQRSLSVPSGAIIAEPADVGHALRALDETLNRSYANTEPRLERVLKVLRDLGGDSEYVPLRDVAKKAGIKGKNRQADVFGTLRDQLVIDSRPCLDDKRQREIKLTGRPLGRFLKGSVEEIMDDLAHIPPEKTKPICQIEPTDSEKIGLESVELGIFSENTPEKSGQPIAENRFSTDFGKIGLVDGNRDEENVKNDDGKPISTYFIPNRIPISGATDADNEDRYIAVEGGYVVFTPDACLSLLDRLVAKKEAVPAYTGVSFRTEEGQKDGINKFTGENGGSV